MTPLGPRIVERIAADGPVSVAEYMAMCLFDPQAGYYTTREPFGAAGDFTTAPEISQMFGEMVGIWLLSAWQAAGAPENVAVAEIGPGRGTLMRDVVRTLSRLAPEMVQRAEFALVEASPRLAAVQRETLAGSASRLAWHATVDTLPQKPLLVVGNEIFDALPVRQFRRAGMHWLERMVGIDDDGRFRFAVGAAALDPALLPPGASDAPEGTIFETAPARTAMMQMLAQRIAGAGVAALFFDYGHLAPGFGDTLQAVRRHQAEDVFACPGEADLTTHVDFSALAAAASAEGLEARTAAQGDFLVAMGLIERAGRLGAPLDEAGRARIGREVERLAGPKEMGRLFKVLAVAPPGLRLPGFGESSDVAGSA